MKEMKKILDRGEEVLWEGKPKFWPFFLNGLISTTLFGLIWFLFLVPFFSIALLSPPKNSTVPANFMWSFNLIFNLALLPFLLVGLAMLFGKPLYKWLVHKYIYYVVTNKRVIIQRGIIGRDFEYIDFDQITNAQVEVGLWDKIVGQSSGSILISSAGSFTITSHGQQVLKPYTLSHIANPYDVFKFIKKVSHDVKTDIEYPNKLRPAENPGYRTDYNADKK